MQLFWFTGLWLLSSYGAFGFLQRSIAVRQLSSSQIVARRSDAQSQLQMRCLATPGIGDDSCMLPSPSGVNQLPKFQQLAIVVGIFSALVAGTVPFVALLDFGSDHLPLFKAWRSTYPILGAIYVAAGLAHFSLKDEFCNIMPATGSWGVWYLPGSKFFHVAWTGVAEFVLGASLFLSYLASFFGYNTTTITQNSALALLILTALVTPANIYMFTHGARLPMNAPPLTNQIHLVRAVLQIILYSILYEIYIGNTNII